MGSPRPLEPSTVAPEVSEYTLSRCIVAAERGGDVPGREFDEVDRGREVLHAHDLRRDAVARALVVVIPEWDRDTRCAVSEEAPCGCLTCPSGHEPSLHRPFGAQLRAPDVKQVLRLRVKRPLTIPDADDRTATDFDARNRPRCLDVDDPIPLRNSTPARRAEGTDETDFLGPGKEGDKGQPPAPPRARPPRQRD